MLIFFPFRDLVYLFGGYEDLGNVILKVQPADLAFNILLGLLLLAPDGPENVPLLFQSAHELHKFINAFKDLLEADIHCEDNQGENKRGHHYHQCTVLQFLPCGPGNFMHQFVIGFPEVIYYSLHFRLN